MGKLTLRQAAEWCGGAVEEKYADVEFLGAANDTRVMQPDSSYQLVDRRGSRKLLNSHRAFSDMAREAAEKALAAVEPTLETTEFKVHQPAEEI